MPRELRKRLSGISRSIMLSDRNDSINRINSVDRINGINRINRINRIDGDGRESIEKKAGENEKYL